MLFLACVTWAEKNLEEITPFIWLILLSPSMIPLEDILITIDSIYGVSCFVCLFLYNQFCHYFAAILPPAIIFKEYSRLFPLQLTSSVFRETSERKQEACCWEKVKPPFIQNKPIKTRLVSSAGCALSGGEKNGFDLCSTPVTRMQSYLQAKRGYQAQKERRVWFRKRQAGPLC